MLDRIRDIRDACDLNLLLFFYRHPRAQLTGKQFVAWLGYDREQIAKLLAGLIEAGLVMRSQNLSHAAGIDRRYGHEAREGGCPVGRARSFEIVKTRGQDYQMRRHRSPRRRGQPPPTSWKGNE